uniref:Uncharacterized protein n=1 Tax=Megaviridae environmental sample TaxID=1737588 RepID=A0A5J6VJ02_9VIRU|nr:MAG: hypothetical protein [Megaviridae environmental sample]
MDTTDPFYPKYLKYKNKYLDLQHSFAVSNSIETFVQNGGNANTDTIKQKLSSFIDQNRTSFDTIKNHLKKVGPEIIQFAGEIDLSDIGVSKTQAIDFVYDIASADLDINTIKQNLISNINFDNNIVEPSLIHKILSVNKQSLIGGQNGGGNNMEFLWLGDLDLNNMTSMFDNDSPIVTFVKAIALFSLISSFATLGRTLFPSYKNLALLNRNLAAGSSSFLSLWASLGILSAGKKVKWNNPVFFFRTMVMFGSIWIMRPLEHASGVNVLEKIGVKNRNENNLKTALNHIKSRVKSEKDNAKALEYAVGAKSKSVNLFAWSDFTADNVKDTVKDLKIKDELDYKDKNLGTNIDELVADLLKKANSSSSDSESGAGAGEGESKGGR